MSEAHPLEQALHKAANDPDARAAFYQALMNSAVHVVGRQEEPEAEGEAPHIQLKQWQQPDGTLAMPFFASLDSLRHTLGDQDPHLVMPVVDLFKMTRDATLVFTTPNGSKAFSQEEIEALLASTIALDPLAISLARAAQENSEEARHEFYQVLVNSQVFVIGKPAGDGNGQEPTYGQRNITENDKFNISSWPHPFLEGEKVVPFFSSQEHLKRAAKKETGFMVFPALTFLTLARSLNAPLLLNPGYDPQKMLSLEEVDFLLNSARPEPFESRHFKPGTKVMLGPPDKYPQELVAALLDFLPEHREVKAAYLAMMREDGEEAAPVLVIGFEADGDLTEMFRGAGPLVGQFAEDGLAIDFARVEKGETGLSEYFLDKVSPFYRRAIIRDGQGVNLDEKDDLKEPVHEEYSRPGFFGRLKRIFSGSK